MVYFIATNKQGISSTELSCKLGLRQKTCWSFKQKVMKTMASSLQFPMVGKDEVDETVIGQEVEGTSTGQLRANSNHVLVDCNDRFQKIILLSDLLLQEGE